MFVIFVFANPIFVYFFSFLFEKDSTGSIVIRIIYLLLGGLMPIVVSTLQMVPKTTDVGNVLRWVFYVIPIFSLDFGIMSLAK